MEQLFPYPAIPSTVAAPPHKLGLALPAANSAEVIRDTASVPMPDSVSSVSEARDVLHWASTVSAPVSGVASLNVLLIVLSNKVSIDADDGIEFGTAYKLNRDLEFVDIVTPAVLAGLHASGIDTLYVFCSTLNVSAFITLFTHLSIKNLRMICSARRIAAPSNARKDAPTVSSLVQHMSCQLLGHPAYALQVLQKPSCSEQDCVFEFANIWLAALRHPALRTLKGWWLGEKTLQPTSARTEGRSLLSVAQTAANQEVDTERRGLTWELAASRRRSEVASIVEDARSGFPYTATIDDKLFMTNVWQTELDPRAWLPVPCAVSPLCDLGSKKYGHHRDRRIFADFSGRVPPSASAKVSLPPANDEDITIGCGSMCRMKTATFEAYTFAAPFTTPKRTATPATSSHRVPSCHTLHQSRGRFPHDSVAEAASAPLR
ncbi:hypothetical protein C8J57DRAFT_1241299 [Mycena rebaudengoi]|nr:hypothetical protein C8J57DRAFT_1241299 [Mycena rebaudengoi]